MKKYKNAVLRNNPVQFMAEALFTVVNTELIVVGWFLK
jgi:hypothetical protein